MEILTAKDVIFNQNLHYPSIDIFENHTTFLQGPSGCGKSTLLKLFNATLSPDQGVISYKGHDISTLNTITLRQEVLLVSQSVYLFDTSISENFDEYYRYRNLPPLSNEEKKDFLHICSADFDLTSNCMNMSGGERQRIYLAICLSLMPKVFMLDEPTSALDYETATRVLENIKSFCQENKITLIVISHDAKLTQHYADHIITLEKKV